MTAEAWDMADAQRYAAALMRGSSTRLRPLRPEDGRVLTAWRQDPASAVLQADTLDPAAGAVRFDEDESGRTRFAVETLPGAEGDGAEGEGAEGDGAEGSGAEEQARLIGVVSLSGVSAQHRSAEFAIALDPAAGGHGYGADATRTMVRFGFRELGLHRVELHVWAFNDRALRTYRRAGFVVEGRRRDAVHHDGRWHDEVLMSALATDPGWPDAAPS